MGRRDIDNLCGVADVEGLCAARIARGEARNDRASGVCLADGGGDELHPDKCLIGCDRTQLTAFVSEIPRDDRLLILEAFYEIADELELPTNDGRVGERILFDKGRGAVIAEAHVTGQKTDDQLHFIPVRESAEFLEMLASLLADSRASRLGVGEGLFVGSAIFVDPHVFEDRLERLKDIPDDEHSERFDSDRRELLKILLYRSRVPFRPHIDRGLRAPVVCSNVKFVILHEHDIFPPKGSCIEPENVI